MRKMIAAAGFLLEGCASMLPQTEWLPHSTHAALPEYHVEVSEQELPRACKNAPALRVHGCAVRMPEAKVCIIYTTPAPAAWVMDHERRHCAGWDHR